MIPGDPSTLPVRVAGRVARPNGTGAPAAVGGTGGPTPRSSYAEALGQIVRLVDAGATPPPIIALDATGQVVVHVRRAELPTWVIHLDLPAPDWTTAEINDELVTFASWSRTVTEGLPLRLICVESRPINPNAAGLCRDCSDLGLRPCNPGCRS